jgi:putative phage-type endonuclease
MARVIASTKGMERSDWLNIRNQYIGGSDAGIILGVNKYKTDLELWLEKTGQVEPKEINNDAIHFGNVLEDVVAQEFAARTGKKVRRRNQMLLHDEHDFMMANIDREVVGEKALLECKTANQYLADEWENDQIPASYLAQVNHYMAVTGYEKAYIACLIGGQKFVWKEIERDNELIELIIQAEKHFWEHHVLGGNRPALDGSSAAEQYVKQKWAWAEKGKGVDLSSEHKDNIEKYLEIKKTIDVFETEKKRLENLLKDAVADAETGSVADYTVNWKNVTSNRVDSKALKEKFPDVYSQVTKESKSRRFEIKGAK